MPSLAQDVERHVLESPCETVAEGLLHQEALRDEDPAVMALARTKFPEEPPKGKKLEQVKQQMMRVHRASGHAAFYPFSDYFAHVEHPSGASTWPEHFNALTALSREDLSCVNHLLQRNHFHSYGRSWAPMFSSMSSGIGNISLFYGAIDRAAVPTRGFHMRALTCVPLCALI